MLNKSNLPVALSLKTAIVFVILLLISLILLVKEGFAPAVYKPKGFSTSYDTAQEDPLEEIDNEYLGVSILICSFNSFLS